MDHASGGPSRNFPNPTTSCAKRHRRGGSRRSSCSGFPQGPGAGAPANADRPKVPDCWVKPCA
eukprot:5888690-Alexandrium_andersonii.AAC.1